MKLLITGAFPASPQQCDVLRENGFSLYFQQDERGAPACDFAEMDAVICNGLFLYHDIAAFKKLRCIQLTSAGLDRVPLDYIRAHGIALYNAGGVYSIPMAEFAVAGILQLYKHLPAFREHQKAHVWQKDREVRELCGQTAAIVGCGSVGTACAKRLCAFGVHCTAVDIVRPTDAAYEAFFDVAHIADALKTADIVLLTLPLTDDTRGMFDKALFAQCKDGAVLVNIARGAVVREDALSDALSAGKLAGAVLDVFEEEPLCENSALWDFDNVIVTPHNAFVSDKNHERLFALVLKNLKNAVEG